MQDEGEESSNSFAIVSNGQDFARRVCRLLNNVIQEKLFGEGFNNSQNNWKFDTVTEE